MLFYKYKVMHHGNDNDNAYKYDKDNSLEQ